MNYANSLMGRSNIPVNYGNQGNGWPQMGMGAPVNEDVPPLFVKHQNAKVVRNDVYVHKDTIRLEVDEHNPDCYLVSFVFDAHFDGSITIYYFGKEEDESCKFSPEYPEAYRPVRFRFRKGLGQRFCQPSGTGIDLGVFELEALGKPSEDDVFPLVIFAEVCSSSPVSNDEERESLPETFLRVQVTQAVIEKKNDTSFQVKVIRQILWIDGVRYEVHELFGIGNSSEQRFNDDDPGKACVICMTEPKNTAVMPCRHLCMCSDCAKELIRLQSNKCPICHQPPTELIEININNTTH